MKYTIKTALLLLAICAAAFAPVYAAGKEDSVYSRISGAIARKLAMRQKENDLLRQQGVPGNYVVYITDNDIMPAMAFPDHVVSLPQKNTKQADVERLWDFSNNTYLKNISERLQKFSQEQGYDYYVVVCAIYNYFRLDENTDFSNITWTSSNMLKSNAESSTPVSSKATNNGGYTNLLHYLIKKFKNDGILPKSDKQSHIYHFVMTTYTPFDNGTDDKPVGRLRHFQGLSWTSPNTDIAFDAVWGTFVQTKQAELAGSNNDQQKKASKEEWLAGFITSNQTMLAAIRNTHPDELMAITTRPELVKKLEEIPDAVYAGFSAKLRIRMLQILAGSSMNGDAEQRACALVEQTPVAQADSVIQFMREANPQIPEQVVSTGDPLNSTATMTSNYQVGWCLLRCLTEFTDDKTLGFAGSDNYHRLIKGLTTLCYKSDGFKQKAKALNDAYLDAADGKLPDRVIFYTYNSFWSKVAGTFKNSQFVIEPKLDFSTSYDGCGLQTEKQLFLSYFMPNTDLQKIKLDPFEPVVFENQTDLGLLTDMNETPSSDHIVPAIIMKYADDKGSNETVSDVTMAAIDVASMATGYGELQAGIKGIRKAWVVFDMINGGVNIVGNLAAYDNPKLKAVLGYYNLATGAVAIGRMTTGAVKSVKNIYNALKAEQTAMSAVNIRNYIKSIKDAGNDIADLRPDDAQRIKSYLQKLKAEANARGLSNFEQSVDEALAAINGVKKVKVIETVEELKEVLDAVDETTTVAQLEERGIKAFFRGTTRNADGTVSPGNPNSIRGEASSTSTDPVVATIFAIENVTRNGSRTGVIQMLIPADVKNLKLLGPNRRVKSELEVIFNAKPEDFSNFVKVEIPLEDAKRLIKEVTGIQLPNRISGIDASTQLVDQLTRTDLTTAKKFYDAALKYNIIK